MKHAKLLDPEIERVIYRWCEARNIGQLCHVGPDRLSKTATMHDGYPDLWGWECQIVTDALFSYGKGIYRPDDLIPLLDFVFWKGHNPEKYAVFQPGRGMPKELLGLGLRSTELACLAIAKFGKMVAAKMREHPKPPPLSEVMKGVAPLGSEQDRKPLRVEKRKK